MTVFTERNYVSDFLKWEVDKNYSRENVVVAAGSGGPRALVGGMVVARVASGGVAAAVANAGNTGTGAITASPTVGAGAKNGVYTLICIEPATDAGTFRLEDPDGVFVATVKVGVAQTAPLGFTVADATDFVAGDGFKITVRDVGSKVKQVDFAATDGSQNAYGVLLFDVTAPDGVDARGVVLVRQAIVDKGNLLWPSGVTAAQKAIALDQLERAGILARNSA